MINHASCENCIDPISLFAGIFVIFSLWANDGKKAYNYNKSSFFRDTPSRKFVLNNLAITGFDSRMSKKSVEKTYK